MAHPRSVTVTTRLTRFAADVLAAVDDGHGARARFCEAASAIFGCAAVGHVWYLAPAHAWSVCLWRSADDAAPTVTTTGLDARLSVDTLASWWASSECRRGVLDAMPAPVTEVALPRASAARSLLVLSPMTQPAGQLARLLDLSLAHIALAERSVVLLDPPALPRAPGEALSTRELEVLGLLGDGLPAHAIARRMGLSERTIHKHLGNIYRKLGVHDRLLAVARGQALGLLGRAEHTFSPALLPDAGPHAG